MGCVSPSKFGLHNPVVLSQPEKHQELDMVTEACDLSTWEDEAGRISSSRPAWVTKEGPISKGKGEGDHNTGLLSMSGWLEGLQ